jgi:fructose transport system substrate-binding protein
MKTITKALLGAGALALMSGMASAESHGVSACLITKTDTNPFFVKMKEGAEAKAAELGVTLKAYAGKVDGDHDSQVTAVESCIADGAKGILIAASDTKAIVGPLQEAREAGILVIALDTPLDPADAADATFATDNLEAGRLIGAWAAATLGEKLPTPRSRS